MTDKQSLMTFPCDFKLKIIGDSHENFLTEIAAIIRKHYPNMPDAAIQSNWSQKGKYLAITATVHAKDQATLDALYMDLTHHPHIRMVL